jgi:hypothetical protein
LDGLYDIARVLQTWTEEGDACCGRQQVTVFLTEQFEEADIVLNDKINLASKEEVAIASSAVVLLGLRVKADL